LPHGYKETSKEPDEIIKQTNGNVKKKDQSIMKEKEKKEKKLVH